MSYYEIWSYCPVNNEQVTWYHICSQNDISLGCPQHLLLFSSKVIADIVWQAMSFLLHCLAISHGLRTRDSESFSKMCIQALRCCWWGLSLCNSWSTSLGNDALNTCQLAFVIPFIMFSMASFNGVQKLIESFYLMSGFHFWHFFLLFYAFNYVLMGTLGSNSLDKDK